MDCSFPVRDSVAKCGTYAEVAAVSVRPLSPSMSALEKDYF